MKIGLVVAGALTTLAGFACTVIGNYIEGKKQSEEIREEVERQLAERCEDEDEEN